MQKKPLNNQWIIYSIVKISKMIIQIEATADRVMDKAKSNIEEIIEKFKKDM